MSIFVASAVYLALPEPALQESFCCVASTEILSGPLGSGPCNQLDPVLQKMRWAIESGQAYGICMHRSKVRLSCRIH